MDARLSKLEVPASTGTLLVGGAGASALTVLAQFLYSLLAGG
jgi:hypothetical protein